MEKSPVVDPHVSRSIDVIRGTAALGVIWGHSMYGINRPVELNGAFWVWVFLPLSGYLVARGFEPQGYGRSPAAFCRFLWNRSLRILPLAWAALLIGALMAWWHDVLPDTTVRQFLFMPPGNAMSLVGPLWTIAAEMQFYVASAVLLPWVAIPPRVRLTAGLVVWPLSLWVAWIWIAAAHDNAFQPRSLVGNLAFFVFGVWLASIRMPPVRVPRILKVALVVAPVALAWYLQNHKAEYFWQWGSDTPYPFGGAAVCALFICLVVVWTSVPAGPSTWDRGPARWGIDGLAWCGFYTYGIYVVHALLTVFDKFIFRLPTGPAMLAYLMLAVPLAPLSYRWYERFWLRFRVGRRSLPVVGAP
ncbi:MAG: hypothetical protein AMXMBFR57_16880 [Acidimicrobiia bacterium]